MIKRRNKNDELMTVYISVTSDEAGLLSNLKCHFNLNVSVGMTRKFGLKILFFFIG